ncbi:MAG: hypothetical protein MZV64_22695 [Ignavibacteriales bacterium]|nr:hypothetical protein [Ignavibacteriales bacterium]
MPRAPRPIPTSAPPRQPLGHRVRPDELPDEGLPGRDHWASATSTSSAKNFSLAFTLDSFSRTRTGYYMRLGLVRPRRRRVRLPLRALRRRRHRSTPSASPTTPLQLSVEVRSRSAARPRSSPSSAAAPRSTSGASGCTATWSISPTPGSTPTTCSATSTSIRSSRSTAARRDGLRLARLRRDPGPDRLPGDLRARGPLPLGQGQVRGVVPRLRRFRARRAGPDGRLQLLVLILDAKTDPGTCTAGTCPLFMIFFRAGAFWVLSKRMTRRPQTEAISIAPGEPAGELVLLETGPDVLPRFEEIEDEGQREGLFSRPREALIPLGWARSGPRGR